MPSRRRVSCLLTLTWLSLRLFGWTTTLELGRRWHRPPQKNLDTATSAEWIAIVDTIVRDAAAEKLVFPISCKERAMVGYQLLRNAFGFPAEIVLGVQLYPFGLHAWVECYGIIATDNPEHCCMYRPVARYS